MARPEKKRKMKYSKIRYYIKNLKFTALLLRVRCMQDYVRFQFQKVQREKIITLDHL